MRTSILLATLLISSLALVGAFDDGSPLEQSDAEDGGGQNAGLDPTLGSVQDTDLDQNQSSSSRNDALDQDQNGPARLNYRPRYHRSQPYYHKSLSNPLVRPCHRHLSPEAIAHIDAKLATIKHAFEVLLDFRKSNPGPQTVALPGVQKLYSMLLPIVQAADQVERKHGYHWYPKFQQQHHHHHRYHEISPLKDY